MINNVSTAVKSGVLFLIGLRYSYAGLLSAEPVMFNNAAEVNGSGYHRQQISWSSLQNNNSTIVNTNTLRWSGIFSGTQIAAVGLFETDRSSDVACYGMLATAEMIETRVNRTGQRDGVGEFTIPAGSITLRVV